MSGPEENAAEAPEAPAPEPSPGDFLKKHVRSIPKEKMKEKRVYYGFRYKDLKGFIDSIIGRYKDMDNPDLVARISELELKLQTLQQQKEGLAKDLEEARAASGAPAGPDPEALKALQEKLDAAEVEKAQLQARIDETQQEMTGSVDEHARRAQDLSAELAALKESYAKLEQENEFLDGEMGKLDAANKALEGEKAALQEQLDALQARLDSEKEGWDKERNTFENRIGEMEKLLEASRDAQKLLEMQREYETYRALLDAYETAAAEAMDIERRPDSDEVASRIAALQGRVQEGSAPETALKQLQESFAIQEERVDELLEEMYAYRGSFRTILDLGKAIAHSQDLADGFRMLDDVTSG